jgi:hypothetical protein
MSGQPIKFTVTLVTVLKCALIRLVLDVDVRVTSEVGFADEALAAFRTLERLVIGLQ